jgi:hypothetical protein
LDGLITPGQGGDVLSGRTILYQKMVNRLDTGGVDACRRPLHFFCIAGVKGKSLFRIFHVVHDPAADTCFPLKLLDKGSRTVINAFIAVIAGPV